MSLRRQLKTVLSFVGDGAEQVDRGDAVGHQGGDDRAGADADVDVEPAGREAAGKEAVEGGQAADFVGRPHDPAAGQDQGCLCLLGHGAFVPRVLARTLSLGFPSSGTIRNSTSRSPNFSRILSFCWSRNAVDLAAAGGGPAGCRPRGLPAVPGRRRQRPPSSGGGLPLRSRPEVLPASGVGPFRQGALLAVVTPFVHQAQDPVPVAGSRCGNGRQGSGIGSAGRSG